MTGSAQLRLFCILLALLLTTGCAPTSLYDWGNYELSLYEFYDNPEEFDDYIESLDKIVNDSESADRVPPGMYAEYGYVLYVSGQTGEALTYFQREKEKWPESAQFMDMMMGNIKATDQETSSPSAETESSSPAGSSEEVAQ